jgi:hypothetical protein
LAAAAEAKRAGDSGVLKAKGPSSFREGAEAAAGGSPCVERELSSERERSRRMGKQGQGDGGADGVAEAKKGMVAAAAEA